ncbi:MAG: PilZ domain-containing protein [Nitrospirota bacterium]
MNRDFLKIGQEVIISFYEDNALRSYSGEIKEADRYLIGINFEADKRKPRCITPGMEVNIRVKDDGEDIYITARIVEDHWPDLIRMDLGDVGGDDRRSYVRVDCMLPMEYRRIDKDNSPWNMEGILESWSAYSFLAETDGSDLELEGSGDLDPRILQRLVFIEKKLDFVINYITQTKERGFKLPRIRSVNISGSGLRFYAEEEFRQGDQLEIIIILPIFPPVSLLLKGEVIRAELRTRDGDKIFEIAIRFLDIDEKDRDKIIIYTIKKQMAILRSKNKT